MKYGWLVYLGSLLIHATLGASVSLIEASQPHERPVIITLQEAPPPPPPETPPKAPDPEPTRAPERRAAPAKAQAAKPTPAQPLAFGITMGNSDGPGGIAVPIGDPSGDPTVKTRSNSVRHLVSSSEVADACTGPSQRPKPLDIPKPEYTAAARAAGIAGKVRVEITVSASGEIEHAKILEGLGFGLDEAALTAVQSARFEPALQCGRPISSTFVIAIRFAQ